MMMMTTMIDHDDHDNGDANTPTKIPRRLKAASSLCSTEHQELRMERDTIEASAAAAQEAAEGRYEALREELRATKETLERESHAKVTLIGRYYLILPTRPQLLLELPDVLLSFL